MARPPQHGNAARPLPQTSAAAKIQTALHLRLPARSYPLHALSHCKNGRRCGRLRQNAVIPQTSLDDNHARHRHAAAFQPPANRAALRRKLRLPSGFLIGCFGRIRRQKGTDVFVDAMLDALPRFPNATVILLGRAAIQHLPYLRRLRQKIAQRGLAERILFFPEVSVRQTAQWYQALDLFVAPQRWEGFGLTPLEAMSCGVPVLATKVGAFEEIIQENQTGLLVAPGCAAELSQAVKSALSNSDRLKIWSENARRRILKNFRLETEAQALNQLYRHLLNDQNTDNAPPENPS